MLDRGYADSREYVLQAVGRIRAMRRTGAADGPRPFQVVTKFKQSGVSRGEIAGLPPTGEEATVVGIHIHRISGGKITEEWSTLDVVPVWENLAQELRERERVEQELRVARTIQQASLPKEVPTLEGWQIAPYFRPAREVGGDFYEFFELDDGRVARD